ncbi:MAG: hypothetical protein MUO54_05850 [Anaerolineales bacterium]|nr:hypothetical protein [Anaerolineales bacterium]
MAGLTEILAKENGFKLSSLEANQRGELTAEQIPLLFSRFFSSLMFILVPGAILIYQLIKLGYFSQPPATISAFIAQVTQMSTGLLIMGVIIIGAVLLGVVQFIKALLDALDKTVHEVQGMGRRQLTTSRDDDGSISRSMYYVIDGNKFSVKRKAFQVFEDGKQYRAYCTPRSKVLVNIEVIE